MQLHAVESRFTGALCGVCKQAGQLRGQVTNVWQVGVGDVLARAVLQGFPLPLVKHFDQFFVGQIQQSCPHFGFRLVRRLTQALAVARRDLEKLLEVAVAMRAAANA